MKIDEAIADFKNWNDMGFSKAETPSSEHILLAIQALELQKQFDDGFFIPKDYHDKVYEKLFERYTNALESQRWIPVSKRLPEYYELVVVFDLRQATYLTRMAHTSDWKLQGITHWFPLPEPPQEV